MKYIFLAFIFIIPSISYGEVNDIRIKHVTTDKKGNIKIYLSFFTGVESYQTQIDNDVLKIKIGNKILPKQNYKIMPFLASDEGIAVLIEVDTSGSMKSALPRIKEFLKQYTTSLRNGKDFSSLAEIGNKFNQITEFSSNHLLLVKALDSLKANQITTALYESIYDGVKLTGTRDSIPTRRLLIVISDGENTNQTRKIEEVIAIAKEKQIDVHVITFHTRPSNIKYMEIAGLWGRIADETNGIRYTTSKSEEIGFGLTKVRDRINGEVLIIFPSTFMGEKGQNSLNISYEKGNVSLDLDKFVENQSKPKPVIKNKTKVKSSEKESSFLWLIVLLSGFVFFVIIVIIIIRKNKKSYELKEAAIRNEVDKLKKAQVKVNEQPIDKPRILPETVATPSGFKRDFEHGEKISRLSVLKNYSEKEFFIIPGSDFTIGFDDKNQIVIKAPSISGSHARVIFNNNKYFIKDLNSSNGSYVDGVKVTDTAIELKKGSSLQLGTVLLICQ